MKKLLIVTPHLSTGGAPQVTANKVQLLLGRFEIMVVEYAFTAWNFVVQRNRILSMVGESGFRSLGPDKLSEMKAVFEGFKPDVVSMEEFPEMFMSEDVSNWLYRSEREYTILETTHDSSFRPSQKRYTPDKFVFVSPYNSLKYVNLEVPQEVIEYPVERITEVDKWEVRRRLGLEPDHMHVVIVGLFTPRKNQRYAFELCERLHEYKVKFHFLGNQADNFQDYWRPLMRWKSENPKLDNCVVWGERSDVDDFMRACDLFLFPSKGDRGNKELNPIAIKEALVYPELPKLMYNLDVYLNRYDEEPNMHYLTGDVDTDASKIVEVTKPKRLSTKDELVVIGTYPNLKSRVRLTKDCIESARAIGRRIMLVSHYPVDEETQRSVDYYVYDADNPLTHHSYYTRFFRHTSDYRFEMNINGLKNSNQSLTVLTNLFTAAKMAKGLGYRRFFYSTYDVILDPRDISVIDTSFESVSSSGTAYLGTLDTPFGKGIETNGMTFDVDFFLSCFDDVREPEDYNAACGRVGAQNFLEDYFVKKISPNADKVKIVDNPEQTLLVHSGRGVSSNSEYYSIVPVAGKQDTYMLFFYTFNVDDRRVSVVMSEDGAEFFNGSFKISRTREFKKEFKYTGKTIDIEIGFHDGEVTYKTERFTMEPGNISKYSQTGAYTPLNVRPKVKLVHIQTTVNDSRERLSRESLMPLRDHGIEYVLHTNELYGDMAPRHNCMRPECVSDHLFDESTTKEKGGTALTPAHYGCYSAFRDAILSEFDDCDVLIVCEGDCLLEVPHETFARSVESAASLMTQHNVGYMSFGDSKTLEHGWPQSPVVDDLGGNELMYVTDHIIGLQCIAFPKFVKGWLKERLRTEKWDASDMYFNNIFYGSPYRMGIVRKRMTTQADGYSFIDKQQKTFR